MSFTDLEFFFDECSVDSCRKATGFCPELTRSFRKGMDRPLPLKTRDQIRIHYLMCSSCERYGKQLDYLHTLARNSLKAAEASSAKLPEETKTRLKQALREQS